MDRSRLHNPSYRTLISDEPPDFRLLQSTTTSSVQEAEVELLISLIFSCLQIFFLLRCRHRSPCSISPPINSAIEEEHEYIQADIHARNDEQVPITAFICVVSHANG